MNVFENEILLFLYRNPKSNHRNIANSLKLSLGLVNKTIHKLIDKNFLNMDLSITQKTKSIIKLNSPKSAIILANDYYLEDTSLNPDIPYGLLTINNEALIERIIMQLHEVGIKNINVVLKSKKEMFEFLIDKYNIKIVILKNGLNDMLKKITNLLDNTYIIPFNIYAKSNYFSSIEINSWCMVNNVIDDKSFIRINKKKELVKDSCNCNKMLNLIYINCNDKAKIINNIKALPDKLKKEKLYLEHYLFQNNKMFTDGRVGDYDNIRQINCYDDLKDFEYNNILNDVVISVIKYTFNINLNDIKNIKVLKKGMTNRSFIFEINNIKYIARIPGEGTNNLINRKKEANVYNRIKNLNICDDLYYINPNNGIKISKYIDNAHTCDVNNPNDLKICIKKLKEFHDLKLSVPHIFNIYKNIDYYESLWPYKSSIYKDYNETKKNVYSLKYFIDANAQEYCLSHIDANADNFLIKGNEVRLIDWEYAGMQDPHIDIAMFCIYSSLSKKEVDNVINIYFNGDCDDMTRLKIYCYISACGLLWSNWCEYKRSLGVEFGEYSLNQYRYAKDFYKIFKVEMEKIQNV